MRDMQVRDDGSVHYVYIVPTRGLLGFRQQFLTATRGQGILNSLFYAYEPLAGEIDTRETGSLIASDSGVSTTYGMYQVQDRGTYFIAPGQDIYEGMVVGQHIRDVDLEINVCKDKHLTNMRNNKGAESIRLDTPRQLSLDDAIEYISEDELVEVTPKGWRIRKKLLNAEDRRREKKKRDMSMA
jgi:GTP-binding protein